MIEAIKIVERRGKPRIETKVRVKIDDMGSDQSSYSGNLSKSGVFLETNEWDIPIGQKIQLQMRLPNADESVKVSGKVSRIVKPNQMGVTPGVGIHFLKVEARQARTFDKLIDK